MRKLLAVFAAISALALGSCDDPAQTFSNIATGVSLVTKSIANPVTRQDEAAVELAVNAGVKLLLAYKRACAVGAADKNCKINVAQIQAYTRPMRPLITQLRNFVDSNDQINAAVVYNQITGLYTNVKTYAASVGINVGSL